MVETGTRTNTREGKAMPDALVAHVTADVANRIVLPKHLSERVSWLVGKEPVDAWLFLVTPERFRLLSDAQVQSDPILAEVRALIVENKPIPAVEPSRADTTVRAAIVARLVPVSITAPSTGWRISIPKVFQTVSPEVRDRKKLSIVFTLEGYLEIWYTEVLRTALYETRD